MWAHESLTKCKKLLRNVCVFRVFKFWEYTVEQCSDKSSGLFTEYAKMFLKLKVGTSVYPGWVLIESDKGKYTK